MNKESKAKRLIINGLSLIIILGVILLGLFTTAPKALTNQDVDLPALKNRVAPDGVKVNLKMASIQIALRLDPNGKLDDSHAADMLTLYRWGREYFGQPKCGPNYQPNQCVLGKVEFIFVDAKKTMSEDGLPQASLFKMFLIGLDQVQIDKLLALDPQPTTAKELMEYLYQVGQETQGTGVNYEEFTNEPYLGLNK